MECVRFTYCTSTVRTSTKTKLMKHVEQLAAKSKYKQTKWTNKCFNCIPSSLSYMYSKLSIVNSPSIVVCQLQVTTDLIQLNATNKHIERIKKIKFIFMYAKHETLKTKCSLLVMKITAMNKRKIDKMERCFACVPNNKFQSNCIQLYSFSWCTCGCHSRPFAAIKYYSKSKNEKGKKVRA